MLERQNDVIGHKRLVFTVHKSDETREPMRKIIIDFFKQSFGFTDDDILFIDRFEFEIPAIKYDF